MKPIFTLLTALLLAPLAFGAGSRQADNEISLQVSPAGHPCVAWGAAQLETALTQAGYPVTPKQFPFFYDLSHSLAYEDLAAGEIVVPMRRWSGDYRKFRGVEYIIGVARP